VQQPQRAIQQEGQHPPDGDRGTHVVGLLGAAQPALGQLHVPVAEVAPHEVVGGLGRVVEAEGVDARGGPLDGALQPREYPAVADLQNFLGQRLSGRFQALDVHEHEAAGVPHLVGEVAAHLELGGAELDVLSLGGQHHQAEADRVGAVLVDHLYGVDAVAQALGHLAAEVVEHRAVDAHVPEGNVLHDLQAHHHHARDPEVDDAPVGDQRVGRVVVVEVGGLLRPAQRGEGPQRGAEPGVQDVLVLDEFVGSAAVALGRCLAGGHRLLAALAVPHRNAVPPPYLPGDAPVAHVLEPGEVDLLPTTGR
jgi:hypothetical protein